MTASPNRSPLRAQRSPRWALRRQGPLLAALLCAALGALAALLPSTSARAAEITDVATAFDVGNPFDFNLRVAYLRTLARADIRREFPAASSRDYFRTVDDLTWSQISNVLNLRAEFGVYKDLQIHVEVPIVLEMQNSYSFASGVGPANSTTVADGICRDAPNSPCGSLLRTGTFDGKSRKGVGEVAFGLTWGAMSQKRDETKPSLNLGFEARVSVGDPMTADNTSVSDGVSKLIWFIVASKRLGRFDPYIGFRYTLPLSRDSSLFQQTGPGEEISGPRQRAAVFAGTEIVLWERPLKHQKITFELFGEVESYFDQKYYSEIWELLAKSPALTGNPNEYQSPGLFSGVTNIENYFRTTGKFNFNVKATEYLHFRAGFWIAHDSSHLLTFASAGQDVNGDRTVNRSDPNVAPKEVNPARRDIIDLPGRRYLLGGSNILSVFIQGSATF